MTSVETQIQSQQIPWKSQFSGVKSLFGGLKGPVQRSLALDLDAFEGSLPPSIPQKWAF